MYFADHPPPHFHVRGAGYECKIAIETGLVIEGQLPPAFGSDFRDWTAAKRTELEENWARIQAHEALRPMDAPGTV